jgi:hypothetical protein
LEYNVGTSPDAVLAQDLNGDGRPDLVAANPTPATISVFLDAEASCALAPDISHVFADPNRISGDEHKMVPVTINYDAVSECGGTLSCKLSVASNFGGRHNWTVIDAHHVRLKADEGECKGDWRHGKEESRKERCRPVYTITVRCTDTRGNSASRRTTVEVERECHR